MKTKITAAITICLFLFSISSSLFANGAHECKTDRPANESNCAMEMKKMDCCPVEQKDDRCTCPEMSDDLSFPNEVSPVVILQPNIYTTDLPVSHFTWLSPDQKNLKENFSDDILHPPLKNNKLYKTIHSFLI